LISKSDIKVGDIVKFRTKKGGKFKKGKVMSTVNDDTITILYDGRNYIVPRGEVYSGK